MGRVLGFVLLSLSLSATAQVVIYNGYATNFPSTVQMAPLLSPPNVALPGSGTPTGAPPALGVNDLRTNAVGAIYVPNSVAATVTGTPAITTPVIVGGIASNESANAAPADNTAAGNVAAGNNAAAPSAPFSAMTRFIPDSGRPAAAAPRPASLGEIAAQLRSRKGPRPPVQSDRVYTNNDVLAMTSTATFRGQTVEVPQADDSNPESDATEQPRPPGGSALQQDSNDRGVLDANDHRAVEAAVERNKKKQERATPPPEQPRE